MKFKYILGLLVLLSIIIITIICCMRKIINKSKITEIESFHYIYTVGNYSEASYVYDLECKDKCIIKIKEVRKTLEETPEIEVNNSIKKRLKNILIKYDIGSWNEFNKAAKNVLDGHSFTLSIKMKESKIYAQGYMKWPKNYDKFKQEIISLFNEYKEENMEK